MSPPLGVLLPKDEAYLRKVLFAVEVLDAVSLSRVSQGLKVRAEGLHGEPIVNASGLFVWKVEDFEQLQKISIDPRALPYQPVDLAASLVTRPLTTIPLAPNGNYPFPAGITGLRGTLIESRLTPPQRPVPIPKASMHLRWLDDDGVTWRDARTTSRTDARGEFVAILRLARTEVPHLDSGKLTVRLRAQRDPLTERGSADLKLPEGSVADPSTFPPDPEVLTFAWDELQP